jgi:FMN-dependent oxidoreductase (nitrilotriacetate monooxygenase family)
MSAQLGQLALNVGLFGLGMHPAAWRDRDGPATDFLDPDYFLAVARIAEEAKFHAIFMPDTIAVEEEHYNRPNLGAMTPTLVQALLAGATRHVGLVATATTTYNDPYGLARRFQTLDHLSKGRAGWNVVTTFAPTTAANFGAAPLPDSAERYERAEEFVDVVKALWLSWERDALVGDKESGVFARPERVHPVAHHGKYFSVHGPSTLPRSPQTHPVLFQAGSAQAGRELAARAVDAVFTVQNTLEDARAYYADIKVRARRHGRKPEAIKVLPGLLPIIGATEAEARQIKQRLDELGGDAELKKLALRLGVRVEDLDLDKPLPLAQIRSNTGFKGSEGFRDAATHLAEQQGLTVRELLYRNGGGHLQVVGTPTQLADTMETWFRAKAADGFNLVIDVQTEGLVRFAESVVPILQQRGLFQKEYRGTTLRENLGLEPLE